jgi:hypothetical protein
MSEEIEDSNQKPTKKLKKSLQNDDLFEKLSQIPFRKTEPDPFPNIFPPEERRELQEKINRIAAGLPIEEEPEITWKGILLIFNLGIVILTSIVAVIQNSEYLGNLILLGVIAVIIFVFVTNLILVLLLGLAWFARSRKEWEFIQKASNTVSRNFNWILYACLIGTSIGLYLFVLPAFPPVHDPFNLNAINPVLGIIYLIWWFLEFIYIALILTFKIDTQTQKFLNYLTDKIIVTE